MAGLGEQVKKGVYGFKIFVKKGVRVVSHSCKQGWYKVKHIKR